MKKLIIATHNKNKFNEIKALLEPFQIICLSLNQIGFDTEIVEDGDSFFENAMKKAKTIAEQYQIPTLGDDSGLIVDAIPDKLGVLSKRFSKEGTDKANNELLLETLKGETNRSAHFVSQLVLYFPDGTYYTYIGKVDGHVANDYLGTHGFGYDPLFIIDELGKRMAELPQEEKNKISHRARALGQLIEDIKHEVLVI